MDVSVVFAMLRQCALCNPPNRPNAFLAYPSPQPKRHLDRFSHFAQLTAVSSGMPGHVISLKIAPWFNPHLIHGSLIGPFTRVHNSNGISIGSVIFAQLTAEYRRACLGMCFPLKLHLRMARFGPTSTAWFLGPTRVQIPNVSRFLGDRL